MNCAHFPECGGCDFLDLDDKNYRQLKRSFLQKIITESKVKIEVEPYWHWIGPHSRRKIIFQISPKNELGFFTKKSNSLVKVESCFVAEEKISTLILALKNLLKISEQNVFTQISATLFDNGLDLIFNAKKEPSFAQNQKLINFAKEHSLNISLRQKSDITPIFVSHKNQIFFGDLRVDLDSNIFIQATKDGLSYITDVINNFVSKNFSNQKISIADLYAGFGAYSFAIKAKNPNYTLAAFEGDSAMVESITKNSKQLGSSKISALQRDLFANPLKTKELRNFDLLILNPPRNGAQTQISEISKLDESAKNKALIYVSCNPQTFLRDSEILLKSNNFKLTYLAALDQFYATKHLEVIGIFERIPI